MENYKSSTVIYESAYLAIEYLQDGALKWEAIKGLLRYGFYGELPESNNPFINMIYTQAIPSMQNAKYRYEKAVSGGKKGGRPTAISTEDIIAMKSNGMTNKQIAEQLGCTIKNIENRITSYNKTHPNNPNNLSVSVSDSDTVSDTVSVSSSVSGACANKEDNTNIKELLEKMDCKQLSNIKRMYDNHVSYTEIAKKYHLRYFDATQFVEIYDNIYQKQYNIEHAEEIVKQQALQKQLLQKEQDELEALRPVAENASAARHQRKRFFEEICNNDQTNKDYTDTTDDDKALQLLAELSGNSPSSDIDSW